MKTKKIIRILKTRAFLVSAALLAIALIGINVLAYRHAYAMLHFSREGDRTGTPESLEGIGKLRILIAGVNIPKPTNHATPSKHGMPFKVHRFSVDEDIELEAWHIPRPGSRVQVVMFHGYAASKADLLSEAKAFYDMGCSAFLVDFRGSGGSNRHETSIGFHEAEDVSRSFKYVRGMMTEETSIILFGRSMGAAALLRASAVHGVEPDAIIIESVFDTLINAVQNRFETMGVPSFPFAHLLVFWGGVQMGFSGFEHNPVEYAAFVECPVLMLHGTDDPRTTKRQAETVFDRLNGGKRFKTFPGVKHESIIHADPETWIRVVGEFLGKHIGG